MKVCHWHPKLRSIVKNIILYRKMFPHIVKSYLFILTIPIVGACLLGKITNMPSKSNNGGWVPVVKQWKGGRGKGMDATHGLFSVFVDNIPSKMDGKSLFRFFSKFGIVKDAFIPSKRRVVSHFRFGFVRFNCHVAAAIAIQKANGLLVDDKVLEVKTATLDRRSREEHNRRYSEVMKTQFNRRSSEVNIFKRHVSSTGQRRSYVDVLQGVKTNTTIKVTEEGNGWLSGSAIIRFNTEYSIPSVTEALKEKGLNHLLVRKGGGRDVILTFNSQEELRSNIGNLKVWFKDLCQFVVEWKSGVHFVQERCVWLKCFGIPLQFWNRNTLNKIGSTWGSVLGIEEDSCQPKSFSHARIRVATPTMELITQSVNLECKGKVYTMLVCEDHLPVLSSMHHNGMCELSFLETCCSVKEANFPVVEGREMGEDDEVAVASAMFGAEIACTHEEIQGKHHTDTVVEQTLCDGGAIREGACDGKNLTDLIKKEGRKQNKIRKNKKTTNLLLDQMQQNSKKYINVQYKATANQSMPIRATANQPTGAWRFLAPSSSLLMKQKNHQAL